MKQLTGIMMDHCQANATVTYFLISAVGENIPYQHNSGSGIPIFSGNTSHFTPIQWHSKPSILDTEIHFNIPPSISGDDSLLLIVITIVITQVIRLKYILWLRSENFQSFKQFNTYLDKRYGRFCTSTSKKLKVHMK